MCGAHRWDITNCACAPQAKAQEKYRNSEKGKAVQVSSDLLLRMGSPVVRFRSSLVVNRQNRLSMLTPQPRCSRHARVNDGGSGTSSSSPCAAQVRPRVLSRALQCPCHVSVSFSTGASVFKMCRAVRGGGQNMSWPRGQPTQPKAQLALSAGALRGWGFGRAGLWG